MRRDHYRSMETSPGITEQISLIEDLKKSRGWGLLRDQLHQDYSYRVTVLARDRKLSKDDTEFTRGVIFALEHLIQLPDLKIKALQQRKRLDDSKKPSKTEVISDV